MSTVELKATENPTVRGKSVEALRKGMRGELNRRFRGNWILDTLDTAHFTLAGVRQYFVDRDGETFRVRRLYRDVFRGNVRQVSAAHVLEVVFPDAPRLAASYDRAYKRGLDAISLAVQKTQAPLVSQIDSVGNSLGVFKTIHALLSRKGLLPFDWTGDKGASQAKKYLTYLQELQILAPAKEGFKLTHQAEARIRRVQETLGAYGHGLDPKSPVPFLALCLENPNHLATNLHLGAPKTYFETLQTVFHYQFNATREEPQKFPMALEKVSRDQLRLFHRRVSPDRLLPRLRDLVSIGALEEPDNLRFGLREKPFFEAAKLVPAAF